MSYIMPVPPDTHHDFVTSSDLSRRDLMLQQQQPQQPIMDIKLDLVSDMRRIENMAPPEIRREMTDVISHDLMLQPDVLTSPMADIRHANQPISLRPSECHSFTTL